MAASTWQRSAEDGAELGELVGAEDGLALGVEEGKLVGEEEGTDVGAYGKRTGGQGVLAAASTWRQSTEEGEALGELLGAEEGLALGDAEGEELGDADGASVGTDEGAYGKTLDGHRVPVAALTER